MVCWEAPVRVAHFPHCCSNGIAVGNSWIRNRTSDLIICRWYIIVSIRSKKNTIPALLNLISHFGTFSGYKINQTISSILFLNRQERNNPTIQHPFKVPCNYDPIVTQVRDSIERWMTLPLTIIGRINVIKTNILPKFLYLFQSIPLTTPPAFFSNMNKLFTKFIWNKKRSRLRLTLLYLPYERGGHQLPNLLWHFRTAQLRSAFFWFSNPSKLSWVQIEEFCARGLTLDRYIQYILTLWKNLNKTRSTFLLKLQLQPGMNHRKCLMHRRDYHHAHLFGVIHYLHLVNRMEVSGSGISSGYRNL